MIKLARIVEQSGMDGQFYDLGKDFANFRRMIDGADQSIRHQYEQQINSKLAGKRVRARASRGYKQYVKDYEFNVSNVTLDDYYDHFVVIAHDRTSSKAKEYFLKPGFKVHILGPSTQNAPRQDQQQQQQQQPPEQPKAPSGPPPQNQPSSNIDSSRASKSTEIPSQLTTESPIQEKNDHGYYDAYSIDEIEKDIKPWISLILAKPQASFRDFANGLGWKKNLDQKTLVAIYELKIPANVIKPNISIQNVKELISKQNEENSKHRITYELVKITPDDSKGIWNFRIKKTKTDL